MPRPLPSSSFHPNPAVKVKCDVAVSNRSCFSWEENNFSVNVSSSTLCLSSLLQRFHLPHPRGPVTAPDPIYRVSLSSGGHVRYLGLRSCNAPETIYSVLLFTLRSLCEKQSATTKTILTKLRPLRILSSTLRASVAPRKSKSRKHFDQYLVRASIALDFSPPNHLVHLTVSPPRLP